MAQLSRVLCLLLALASGPLAADCSWPEWLKFRDSYISADGRVIDRSDPRMVTTSEGQSYALFFAIAANDRATFDRLLRWTEDNLAQGDLGRHLPAWLWGQQPDGTWGVLDSNPASDSDLWIAYSLAEAAQLWNYRRYRILSTLVGRNLQAAEIEDLPGLGPTLLPAPNGFKESPQRWRLNPSYVPLQVLRGLHKRQPDAGWDRLLPSSRRLLLESAPRGFAPDWALYDTRQGFLPDVQTDADGSYNAIRVYLWAGMLDAGDPDRGTLLKLFQPMASLTAKNSYPPEHVHAVTGNARNAGFSGFSAALLPLLASVSPDALLVQRKRLPAQASSAQAAAYYENVLTLFGRGWDQGRFRFGVEGNLRPQWKNRACAALP